MRGAYDEVACFNQNCHSIFTTSKVDQILYHSKDFFPRGPVYGCNKCCLAVTQALASKEIEIAPPTICQICAGVNGNQTILQLFANGEQVIWLCPNCVELQYPTLQSNFYLIQHSVPQRESIPFFTYDLPTEPPKKRALSPSGDEASPPFKKRLTRIPLSNQGPLPWESSLSAAVNQQESKKKIILFANFFSFLISIIRNLCSFGTVTNFTEPTTIKFKKYSNKYFSIFGF